MEHEAQSADEAKAESVYKKYAASRGALEAVLDTLDKKNNADADYPEALGLLIDALGERTPSTCLAFVIGRLAETVDALEEDDETDDVCNDCRDVEAVQGTHTALDSLKE